MFNRNLILPRSGSETFFLWGPRQAGKSTLLRRHYPRGRWIDLLKSDEFRRYATRPELLRMELETARPDPERQVVIDEVQKVPALLNEVHWLMENRSFHFALCGSSARKVRRGAANLLGGRALRYELRGLTAAEIGSGLDLDRLLNRGYLPRIHQAARHRQLLDAYIADYLREEVAAEGMVRSLPAFSRFLDVAAQSDTEPVNFSNIARECGVSSPTVKGYFGILEDTLLGRWLPAWRKRRKRRLIGAPKFYFADVGVVNRLARRGTVHRGSELYGKAFENWVHHELAAFVAYTDLDAELTHWRLPSGVEVDFVLGDMALAVEAKASETVGRHHLKGLRSLALEHDPGRRVVVCLEPRPRRTPDGIEVLPAETFVRRLWEGKLVTFRITAATTALPAHGHESPQDPAPASAPDPP
ncbi:MAG: AAA family ATPase [Gemmatimonadota bacterium]|nr:AAA family ATPase [Gemmatimonadota bacterium]MDE2873092.1 AAA family ATPase [Gemmatimonadota bacterium]